MRLSKLIMLVTVSIFMLTWLVGLSTTTAQAQEVKWERIEGTIGNFVGTVLDLVTGLPVTVVNFVGSGTGKVAPGAPWSTTEGKAQVNLGNGDVAFEVKGLVLAVRNSIGTPGAVTQVVGTLVCDTDGSAGSGGGVNSVLVDTPSVPLSAQGDAKFSGNVSLPAACNEPDIAFLIRAFIQNAPGRWIANGAVRIP